MAALEKALRPTPRRLDAIVSDCIPYIVRCSTVHDQERASRPTAQIPSAPEKLSPAAAKPHLSILSPKQIPIPEHLTSRSSSFSRQPTKWTRCLHKRSRPKPRRTFICISALARPSEGMQHSRSAQARNCLQSSSKMHIHLPQSCTSSKLARQNVR